MCLKHCSRFTLHDLPNLGITFEDLGFFLSLGIWCFDLFLWCISLLKHITKCKSSKNVSLLYLIFKYVILESILKYVSDYLYDVEEIVKCLNLRSICMDKCRLIER